MGARALGALAAGACLLALAVGPAAAEPPSGGRFTPGESLAGARLGMTQSQLEDVWGRRHGICRSCRERTWYFNEQPFKPQGTGAVFEQGRLVHAFTVWQPAGWTTPQGLALGDHGGKVGGTYGLTAERACAGYTALVLEEGGAASVFYVYGDEVWGFGLMRPGRSPCL